MDFVNEFVLRFTTKHLYQRTVFESRHYISLGKTFFYSLDKNFLILVKALKRLLAVVHKLFMCLVKVSLWSMVISRSFTSLVLFICSFFIKNMTFLLLIDDPRHIIRNLTGLVFIILI